MIPYKLENHSFNLPTSWEEITVKQWLSLRSTKDDDFCTILSILSGLDRDLWFNTREIDVAEKIIPNLMWLSKPIDPNIYPVPEKVMLNGVETVIPKDLTLKTFGQKLTFQQQLSEFTDKEGRIQDYFIPMAIGIYLCPEPFSDSEVEKLIPAIDELPIVEAYPVWAFFLTKFVGS